MAREGFHSYDEVAEEARRQGLKLSPRTIYSMISGDNWSREKLEALCQALKCQPADIVNGWQNSNGDNRNTHESPQPVKELQAEPS